MSSRRLLSASWTVFGVGLSVLGLAVWQALSRGDEKSPDAPGRESSPSPRGPILVGRGRFEINERPPRSRGDADSARSLQEALAALRVAFSSTEALRLCHLAADAYAWDDRSRSAISDALSLAIKGAGWETCEHLLVIARAVKDPELAGALAVAFADAVPRLDEKSSDALFALGEDLALLMLATKAEVPPALADASQGSVGAQLVLVEFAAAGGKVNLEGLSRSQDPLVRALSLLVAARAEGTLDAGSLSDSLKAHKLSAPYEKKLLGLALRSLPAEQAVVLIRDRAAGSAVLAIDMLPVASSLMRTPDGAARAPAVLAAVIGAVEASESSEQRGQLAMLGFALRDERLSDEKEAALERYLTTPASEPREVPDDTARTALVQVLTARYPEDRIWKLVTTGARQSDYGVVTGALAAFQSAKTVGFFSVDAHRADLVSIVSGYLRSPPERRIALLNVLAEVSRVHGLEEMRPNFARFVADREGTEAANELRSILDRWK